MPLGKVGMEGILDLFKLGSQLRRPDPEGSLPSFAEMGTATVSGSGATDDAPASALVSSTTATASTDEDEDESEHSPAPDDDPEGSAASHRRITWRGAGVGP